MISIVKQYLIDGPSFIKLFLVKSDKALEIIENSYILESCYSEVGDLIANRCLMEEEEEEKNRIISIGEDLMDIMKNVDTLKGTWDNFRTMLDIAIYKNINFRDVSYLWNAKEMKLTLLTDNEKLNKIGNKLEIVSKTVENL